MTSVGCEEVMVEAGVSFEVEALRLQEDAQRAGPAPPLAVGVSRVSKDEECAPFHRQFQLSPWDRWSPEKDSGSIPFPEPYPGSASTFTRSRQEAPMAEDCTRGDLRSRASACFSQSVIAHAHSYRMARLRERKSNTFDLVFNA